MPAASLTSLARAIARAVASGPREARGRLGASLAASLTLAALGGAVAALVPSAVGAAVAALTAGSHGPTRAPPSALRPLFEGRLAPVALGLAALVVALSVLASVASVRRSARLGAELTSALRVAVLRAALSASARALDEAGRALGAAPPGPPGAAPPGARPPGAAPPGARAPAGPNVRALEAVKLAIARDAGLAADFLVSVLTSTPQAVVALAVIAVELALGGFAHLLAAAAALFVASRVFAGRASRRVSEAMRAMQQREAALFSGAGEWLAASEELRLVGARDHAVLEFAAASRACADARIRFAAALAVSGQVKSLFIALSPIAVLAALVAVGRAPGAGEVAKLLLVMPLVMSRFEALDALRSGVVERRSLLESLAGLLALPAYPPAPAAPREPEPGLAIAFEQVTFAPEGAPRPLLAGVSLAIAPGECVALVGASGSGKSTLLRMLLRLDEPTSGAVRLGGVDLRDVAPERLPKLFRVLGQASRLLERSVRENLTLGLATSPDDAALVRALEAVELARLSGPDGLETVVRAAPPNLSGGEQRRLLLARAMLREGGVIVLDEPEAGLPPATAEALLARVRELAAGHTCVVATHAPRLVGATRIVVLEAGAVVDQGDHEALLARCAAYAKLHRPGPA